MKTQARGKEQLELASEGEGGDLVHGAWPSEYPLALCGAILPHATLEDAKKKCLGPICEPCANYARALTDRTRQNPHRQQGG